MLDQNPTDIDFLQMGNLMINQRNNIYDGKCILCIAMHFFLKCLSLIILLPSVSLALNVQLTVDERVQVSRTSEPTSYGVPLARDANILSTSKLGIFSSDGPELPAQFRVLSRYGGKPDDPTRPIRMVLCDVQLDVGASASRVLFLRDDGSGTTVGPNLATENPLHIVLSTGPMTMRIKKTGTFNLFDDVQIDTTGDGILDSQVVAPTNADGIYVKSDSVTYSSNNMEPSLVTIEENGPLRAIVKVRGMYADVFGNVLKPPLGDTGLEYTVRIIAYKDKSYIRLFYTMMSNNFGWATHTDAHNTNLDWVKLTTTLSLASNKTAAFSSYSGAYTTGNFVLLQDHKENQQAEDGNFSYVVTRDGTGVSTGTRFDSFADLRDISKGLMVASRWFWQNWPKGIAINNNAVDFYLWPDTPTDHIFIGSHYKTYELLYYFHGTVPQSYNYSRELAALKARLYLLATDRYYSSTDFLDFVPPATIKTDYTFPGGESLDTAINAWNDRIRAMFDSAYSNDSQSKKTFTDLRETRPLKWSGGVFNGQYMNWYGWLDFGDMPRAGNYGFPALHYNWDYFLPLHGLRFKNYEMVELGEQMARHKSDIDVIHDPEGADLSYGFTEDWYRGGLRYEYDAHYQLGNWTRTISRNFDPHNGAHSWIKGIILQYFLTGDESYKETIVQNAEHWKYNFNKNTKKEYDCFAGPCWNTQESRQVTRVIDMLTDIYKALGDEYYLTLANSIFTNSVLANLEVKKDGVPQGYLYYPTVQQNCCGVQCDSHIFYDSLSTKPFINLYFELLDNGKTSEATNIIDFLKRRAIWLNNKVFTNYEAGVCGTYGIGENIGKYFPYITRTDWKEGCPWTGDTGTTNYLAYAFVQADLFALIYQTSGEKKWLDIARAIFKDGMLYKNYGEYQDIALQPKISSFSSETLSNSWLKQGIEREKPMYYLYIESHPKILGMENM